MAPSRSSLHQLISYFFKRLCGLWSFSIFSQGLIHVFSVLLKLTWLMKLWYILYSISLNVGSLGCTEPLGGMYSNRVIFPTNCYAGCSCVYCWGGVGVFSVFLFWEHDLREYWSYCYWGGKYIIWYLTINFQYLPTTMLLSFRFCNASYASECLS